MSMFYNSSIPIWFIILIAALFIWTYVWKGLALWQSAKNGHLGWFIFFLIVNTIGIVEIIYLYYIAPKKGSGETIVPLTQSFN